MQEAGFFAEWMYIFLNNSKVDFNFCENICDSKIQEQILLSISYNSFPNINNQLRILLIISKMYRSHFFDSHLLQSVCCLRATTHRIKLKGETQA